MFSKALVVDDHASVNKGVSDILRSQGIPEVVSCYYCDDAFLKIKRAELDKLPFDLVITDLFFKKDHRDFQLESGKDLIRKLHEENYNLSIIVFSQEEQFKTIRDLIFDFGVKAYVWKGREGERDLLKAMNKVLNNEQFLSKKVERALHKDDSFEISNYDLRLLKLLSNGLSQLEISIYLSNKGISPSSLSSVEKRLNSLKDQFRANNSIHLISMMKDQKLI